MSLNRLFQGGVGLIRRHPVLAFFISVAVVYVSTGTYGGIQSRDTITAGFASWVLASHHSVDLRHVISHVPPGALELARGVHGAVVSNRFPGAVLLAAPFYLIGGAGYSPVPATLAAAIAAAGACALLYRVLLKLQSPKVALGGAALFAFATAQWTVSGRELWQHSGSTLFIAAAMLAILSHRWALAGLASGVTLLFRPHLGIGAAALGIGLLILERRLRPALAFTLAVFPGLIGYLGWNWLVYGHLTLSGGYATGDGGISAGGVGVLGFLDNIGGTLVSPERGLLVCSPVLLLAIIGLRPGWRHSTPVVRLFAIAGLAYLASQLWLIRYSGGDGFFGYRTCLETLLWCTPLLVQAGVEGIRRVGYGIAWFLTGATVIFFSACAFDLGEVMGQYNPWTSWAPIQLVTSYGTVRLLVGAAVGFGAVFVVWAISTGRITWLTKRAAVSTAESSREESVEASSPIVVG